MKLRFIYMLAAVAGVSFLFLVKMMYDMNLHMEQMTIQITSMATNMQQMANDVHGMREGVDRMSMAIQRGGQQMEKMNPMDMMRGPIPRP